MPAIGDQHKAAAGTATTNNPFEEPRARISEYTAQEIATLQSRLDKQLGPEFISSRPGASGQKVHYLAAEKVINLANEVFGFNGWSSAIQNIQIDFVDENAQTGKISLGLSVIVRVTLKDGTFHEDIGYGHIENCKGKAAAFEKAKKEGTTDALKRALRTFGNILGNCVYDKEFVARVTKIKVRASKWDADNLHRHPDFAPVKKEEVGDIKGNCFGAGTNDSSVHEVDDGFDMADFSEADFAEDDVVHPDEVVLPAEQPDSRQAMHTAAKAPQIGTSMINGITTPSKPPNAGAHSAPGGPVGPPRGPQTRMQGQAGHHPPQRPSGPPGMPQAGLPASAARSPVKLPPIRDPVQNTSAQSSPPNGVAPAHAAPGLPQQGLQPTAPPPNGVASAHAAPGLPQQGLQPTAPPSLGVAFYSARAATIIDADNNAIPTAPTAIPRFNPHAESPSIRKTAGIDHNKSVPLKRDVLVMKDGGVPPRDFIDPRADPSRRLGIPGQAGQSPMGKGPNASAYRPPTRKGPFEGNTNMNTNPSMNAPGNTHLGGVPTGGGLDRSAAAKRPPLSEVGNNLNMQHHNVTAVTGDGFDAKRQRTMGPSAAAAAEPENAGGARRAD